MKKIYLLPLLLLITIVSMAQEKASFHYQVITLKSDYDKNTERWFVRMNAEGGFQEFPEFKKLIQYSEKRSVPNQPSTFYTAQTDTASTYYNFFLTTTQALNYLANHDWEMMQVIGNTSGDRYGVTTQAIYYFRKRKL